MRKNMSTRKGHIGLDARKFSCAKISTFTVSVNISIYLTIDLITLSQENV